MNDLQKESNYCMLPQWAMACVVRLCMATGYGGPIAMATYTGEWPKRVGVTDNPNSYLWKPHDPTEPCVIILPPEAEDAPKWTSVICHEFIHVLYDKADRFVRKNLPESEHDEFMELVEEAVRFVTPLAWWAQESKVEFVPDGEGANS